MNISGIVTTGALGAVATISGSGFGATQSTTKVYFYPYWGGHVAIYPSAWSDISITVAVPDTGDVGQTGYFVIQKDDGAPGVRTPGFAVLAAVVPTWTEYAYNTFVTAKPGAVGDNPELQY
jgi:hypothetical protein